MGSEMCIRDSSNSSAEYRPLREIESVRFEKVELGDDKYELQYQVAGGRISFDEQMKDWSSRHDSQNWRLRELLLRFTEVTIEDANVVFRVVPPEHLKETSIERNGFGDHFEYIWDVHFANDLKDVIAVECDLSVANRSNPLVKIARERYYETEDKLNDFNSFCASVVWCLTCLLYTSPSPRDLSTSRMPSSA